MRDPLAVARESFFMSSSRNDREDQRSEAAADASENPRAHGLRPEGEGHGYTEGSPFVPLMWVGAVFLGVLLFGILSR
jgi:hypothetical protein